MNSFTPQSSYSYEEIIECGKGNLFGPGNAQLPAPPMLMFLFLLTQRRGFIFLKITKKTQQLALPVCFHKQMSIIDV